MSCHEHRTTDAYVGRVGDLCVQVSRLIGEHLERRSAPRRTTPRPIDGTAPVPQDARRHADGGGEREREMLAKLNAWMIGLACVAGCGDTAAEPPPPPAPPEVVTGMTAASAAECPFGGTVVSSGLDVNHNGALDPGEGQTRTVLCSDPPVVPPPQVVVRLVSEPVGDHCTLGGTAVQSGPDRNGNGRLDDDEVAQVEYACGEALVRRIIAEPPGARCIAGGVAFQFGRDRDRDGELGDDEVEVTEPECGTELVRDVTVQTAADAVALAGITLIDGSLRVTGTGLSELSLANLVQIRGALTIANNDALVRVALPALQAVDDALSLAHDRALASLELPGLHRVGSLIVDQDAALPDLAGLSGLNVAAHEIQISDNAALTSVDLPITTIGDALTVARNPRLARIASSLRQSLPRVRVVANDRLERVDLSTVEFAAFDDVAISGNALLDHIALSADNLGAIAIEDNPSLSNVVATLTLQIRGDVVIRNNGPLSLTLVGSSFFGLPTEITGSLTLSGPVETFFSSPRLLVDGDCTIDGTQLSVLDSQSSFAGVGGTLRVTHNPQLATMTRLGLGGGLEVRDNTALTELGVLFQDQDELEGDLIVVDNPALRTAASLAGLARIHGDVHIASNPALTGVFGAALSTIDGDLTLDHDASLGALGLPRLTRVRSLAVTDCPRVTGLDLSALATASSLELRGNATLGHLQLPRLRQADLGVFDNPRLPACEVIAVFAGLLGEHHQSGNDDLAECK